jgi:hypothetical protein
VGLINRTVEADAYPEVEAQFKVGIGDGERSLVEARQKVGRRWD